MIRRKLNLVTLLIVMLFSTACSDWLEVLPPQSLVQDEYWQTKEHVEQVLMGAYKKAAQLDERYFMLGEIRADNIGYVNSTSKLYGNKYLNEGSNRFRLFLGEILPQNDLCEWGDFYEIINLCNYVIEYAPDVLEKDDLFSEVEYNGYISEAVFLRALMYFYLVRTYRDVPLVLQSAKTDDQDFSIPKSKEIDILNYIITTLEEQRFGTTDDFGSLEGNKGRAGQAAFDALLADVYLWRASAYDNPDDYRKCIQYCENIESNSRYLLLPGTAWFENFFPGNSLESIFEYQLGAEFNLANKMYAATTGQSLTYRGYYETLFFDLYGENPDETREIVRSYGTLTSNFEFRILKYSQQISGKSPSPRPSELQKSANWIEYRLADIILMRAEAHVQLGELQEALDAVNLIHDRAFSLEEIPQAVSQTSSSDLEKLVLQERNLELAYEGKRWWDLLRYGRRNNYANKTDFIQLSNENLPNNIAIIIRNRMLDKDSWFLPITEAELKRNRNLTQNPYYEPFTNVEWD